jgi:hypothetical protein
LFASDKMPSGSELRASDLLPGAGTWTPEIAAPRQTKVGPWSCRDLERSREKNTASITNVQNAFDQT